MLTEIKELGLVYKTPKSKRKSRQAIYRCPCGAEMQLQSFNTSDYPDRFCRSCAAKKRNLKPVESLMSARYVAMKQRCYNPRHKNYHRYGGRGIKVYAEWLKKPEEYNKYIASLLNAFVKDYSIDRINNDGDYEPDNLKWSTKLEQMNNKTQGNQYGRV